MAEAKTDRKFKLLDDSPVTEDSFGSHARIADSIADYIGSESPGATIGLEGTWGSGKSSIISMLQKRWEGREDVRLFLFDAWAHEGDSLRRSFLENLIKRLQTGSGEAIRWLASRDESCKRPRSECRRCTRRGECRPDIIREELRNRREQSTVDSKPDPSKWAVAFALTTMLMPIGVALISSARNLVDWYLILGIGMAYASPILVAAFLAWRWKWRAQGDEYIADILGKTREITTHVSQRGVDPTSIEFEEYYSEILELCSSKHQDRKLVVVLDNLDRLTKDAAMNAWATMRTFVGGHSVEAKDVRRNVWLIVPYDTDALDHLWAGNVEESDHGDHQESLARAFKQKTFQIRYRVAPPLASRWEDYFKEHLKVACASAPESDRHAIYRIFRIQALPTYESAFPTPRQMKVFINRVVALAHQSKSDSTLPEIALYAALEMGDTNVIDYLLKAALPLELEVLEILASDWAAGLAALHFGVARESASEVLLGPRLREILEAGDAERLSRLLASKPAQQFCEHFVKAELASARLSSLLSASSAIAPCREESLSPHVGRSLEFIARMVASTTEDEWGVQGAITDKSAPEVQRLLRLYPDISPAIQHRLSITLTGTSDDTDAHIARWVKAVSRIVSVLAEDVEFSGLYISMPEIQHYSTLVHQLACGEDTQEMIRFFMPSEDRKGIYLNLVGDHTANGVGQKSSHVLRGILAMKCWSKEDIPDIISKAIGKSLRGDLTGGNLVGALRFLMEQANAGNACPNWSMQIEDFARSKHIFPALKRNSGRPAATAWCVSLLLLFNPKPEAVDDSHPSFAGLQRYEQFLDGDEGTAIHEIADACVAYALADKILSSIEDNGLEQRTFTKSLLVQLVSHDQAAIGLTPEVFLDHHNLIRAILDTDVEDDKPNHYQQHLNHLSEYSSDSLLRELETRGIDVALMPVYYTVISNGSEDIERLVEMIRAFFSVELGKDQWLQALLEQSWLLNVVQLLHDYPQGLSLRHEYLGALIEHAMQLRDGKTKIRPNPRQFDWSILEHCLAKNEVNPFRSRLVLEVIGDGSKPLTPLLHVYGLAIQVALASVLSNAATKERQPLELAIIRLAEHEEVQHRDWMVSTLINHTDVSRMSKNTITCLRDRLREHLAEIVSRSDTESESEQASTAFPVTPDQAKQLQRRLGIGDQEIDDSPNPDDD